MRKDKGRRRTNTYFSLLMLTMYKMRAAELAQQVRALDALPGLGFEAQHPHDIHVHPLSSFRGSIPFLWPLLVIAHTWYTDMHARKTPMHTHCCTQSVDSPPPRQKKKKTPRDQI